MVPVVIITLARGIKPGLPLLAREADSMHHIANPVIPAGMNVREIKKYKGFDAYLTAKERLKKLKTQQQLTLRK